MCLNHLQTLTCLKSQKTVSCEASDCGNTATNSDLWPKMVRNQTTQPWQWRQMLERGCAMLKGAANQSGSRANNGKKQASGRPLKHHPVLLMSTGAPSPPSSGIFVRAHHRVRWLQCSCDPRQKQKDQPTSKQLRKLLFLTDEQQLVQWCGIAMWLKRIFSSMESAEKMNGRRSWKMWK